MLDLPEGLQEPVLVLTELAEIGFGGNEVGRVEEMLLELGRLESETDADFDRTSRTLFAMEKELEVATFFWYQVILWISNLVDIAKRVGKCFRI